MSVSTTATGHAPESVVLLLQGTAASDHPGIVDGYEQLRGNGTIRELGVFPVFGPHGVDQGESFWRSVLSHAYDTSASLVVFQYYHSDRLPDPRPWIRRLRELPSGPIVLLTLGDAFMNGYFGRPNVPKSFLAAASAADLVALTSLGALADYIDRFTDAPLVLSPNAVCQVRFGSHHETPSTSQAEFDLVFVGSRNRSRNPLRSYHWLAQRRERLVEALSRRFSKRFAVFGHGWDDLPNALGPVPFAEQVAAVRRGRVVVGGIPFSHARYYTSNRPFIQATSAVPIVDVQVSGVETLPQDGRHWLLAPESELMARIDQALEMFDAERATLGTEAAQYVLERHTQAHRVATLVENVRRVRGAREGGDRLPPHLPFFLDGVDQASEGRMAVRRWPGSP